MGKKKKIIEEKIIKEEIIKIEVVETKQIDYSPLTEVDYKWLVEVLPRNKTRLQVKDSVRLWYLKNNVDGNKEPRPCLCSSSGKHWLRCLNILNEYINSKK